MGHNTQRGQTIVEFLIISLATLLLLFATVIPQFELSKKRIEDARISKKISNEREH